MKINEKFWFPQIKSGCANDTGSTKYPSGIKDDYRFISLSFSPKR
jgi:hypothetical protein